jgi:hypothetical protein
MAHGRLAKLSLEGLRYTQEICPQSIAVAAARLYAWNRLPSSAWRRLAAEPTLLASRASSVAGQTWTQVAAGPPMAPWCVWRPRVDPVEPAGRRWKVYVSPHPLHLAEAVSASMTACAGLPVVSLKYGADAPGMLRPDKLVVHLATFEAVHLLASRIVRSLNGCPVQGVPFTAELGGDGLVSWGCDPPAGSSAARVAPSWRTWVTRKLAEGLAGEGGDGAQPWERALQKIERAGVDPLTWAPRCELWANTDPE